MDVVLVNLWWAVAVILVEWPIAAYVFLSGPGRSLNRLLALFMFLESLIVAGYNGVEQALPDDLRRGTIGVASVAISVAAWVYALFLGRVLNTPLVRPLESRVVRGVIIVLAAASAVLFFVVPDAYGRYGPGANGPVTWHGGGVLNAFFNGGAAVLFLYAFVAALDAFRRAAPGTETRRRTRLYAWSFGLRDFLLGTFLITDVVFRQGRVIDGMSEKGFNIVASITIAYAVILAYAVLKWELFDFELKLKWSLRRGTLAGVFIAMFFVVNQLVEAVMGSTFGAVPGAVAAGLLLFALRPLERWSQRLADAAMPDVHPTPEYAAFRKLEVYRAALESALHGGVSAKERRTLEALRAKLGITTTDASMLEQDVRASAAA